MNNINIDMKDKRKSEDRLEELNSVGTFVSSEIDNDDFDNSELIDSSQKSSYIIESKEEFK